MEKYLDYIVEQIVTLTNIPSPSGYTHKAIAYLEGILKDLNIKCHVTGKGSLIATIDGLDNTKSRTISAHVDTLGAMVKEIKRNGHIRFDKIGGYMMNSIEGENCVIETLTEKQYSGTILTTKPSIHIHSDAGEIARNQETMEVVLDEKADSKEAVEKLGIEIGDFIFFDPRTKVTESGFIKSRHLDDKASIGILLGIIRYLTENHITPAYQTHFFFSVFEEVGHGAAASVPDNTFEFLVIDMGAPGRGQNSSEYAVCICAKDSHGPYNYEFRKKLTMLCREKNIDYRIDLYPSYGSDANSALRAGHDFKTALIGTGVFASHSYERTHRDGILNTARLIAAYIEA
ncbi:MAG: M42 family metallopeptidase [Pelosinus sp.]|nr:M42 family metallopeptidase [Pelosinus sp.]